MFQYKVIIKMFSKAHYIGFKREFQNPHSQFLKMNKNGGGCFIKILKLIYEHL